MIATAQNHAVQILPKSFFAQPPHERRLKNVLVIDDDPDFANALKFGLEQTGRYQISIALDPFEGANQLADRPFDLVVTDCMLQDWDGVTTLENADHLIDVDPTVEDQWANLNPVSVLICSGAPVRMNDLRRASKLKHFSVVGFLPKVTGLTSICRSVDKLTHPQF